MTLAKSIETGQITHRAADIYETFFVPALFQQWAEPVANAARIKPGFQVLDVACGTGVLARHLADRVGPAGRVSGIDINGGMLDVAQRTCPSVDWHEGRAEELPFTDASFDAVVSQFGLMFFDDREQAIREMTRVLKPGRHLAVAVWDRLDNTPGYQAAAALLERLFGARIAESIRSPYVLGDVAELSGLFDSDDLIEVSITTSPGFARFDSIEDWMHTDIRGWTLDGVLSAEQYDLLLSEARVQLKEFILEDERVVFHSPAHIVSATRAA